MTPDEKYRPLLPRDPRTDLVGSTAASINFSPCLSCTPNTAQLARDLRSGDSGTPHPDSNLSPPLPREERGSRRRREEAEEEEKKNLKRTLGIHITFNVPAAVEKVALLFPFDLHMLENPPSCSPICSSITSPVSFSLRRSLTFAACPC